MHVGLDDKITMIPCVQPEAVVSAMSETVDYGHKIMNVESAWADTMGAGVKVVVLDTGAPNHIDIDVAGSVGIVHGDRYVEDMCGHATHVGGIISAKAKNGIGVRGIAPEARTWYGAVLDAMGSGSIKSIISGIYWAVDDVHADIVNMSLGIVGTSYIDPELKRACDYACRSGVTLFGAAGNEGGSVDYPARFDSVIAVGAVNRNLDPADFSCHGPQVEFAAGGVDVYSTYLNNTYCRMSGTSMATPMLSGIACLLISKAKKEGRVLSPDGVRDELKKICRDIGEAGKDDYTGYGIPVFSNADGSTYNSTAGMSWWVRLLKYLGLK